MIELVIRNDPETPLWMRTMGGGFKIGFLLGTVHIAIGNIAREFFGS